MQDTMTVSEVAQLCRVSRWTIYRLVKSGDIPHRRVGRGLRFSRSAIVEWLAGRQPRLKLEV